MKIEIKENVQRQDIWWRALAMFLFTILYGIAEIVIVAVVLFQFFSTLVFRRTNARLVAFGHSLCTYVYQILRFLTFTSEDHPFPLSEWPRGSQTNDDHYGDSAA